jgi:hypothetical protein
MLPLNIQKRSLFNYPIIRNALFALFLLSLVMDADMLLSPILMARGIIHPPPSGGPVHILIAIFEISLIVAGTILWLSMLNFCLRYSERGVGRRILWALAFCFGIWWTAQFYYVFRYRRSFLRSL